MIFVNTKKTRFILAVLLFIIMFVGYFSSKAQARKQNQASTTISTPIISYRMDECSWDNDSNTYEVKDNGTLKDNATAVNGANTVEDGVLCRAGDFIGTKQILPKNPIHLGNHYTVSLWIKFPLDNESHVTYCFNESWKEVDCNSAKVKHKRVYYNIADREGSYSSFIFFQHARDRDKVWWQWGDWYWQVCVDDYDGSPHCVDFSQPSDGWHMVTFVATEGWRWWRDTTDIYLDGEYKSYINYVLDNVSLNRIGASDFNGNISGQTIGAYIDEFKIWNAALTESQIKKIYENESNGKNYNGDIRNCPICCQPSYNGPITPIEFEGGEVTLKNTYKDPTWTHITFKKPFLKSPVIFMVIDNNGSNPASVRIKNVTTTGFDASLVEPEGEDGPHIAQTLDYFAINKGVHRLGNHYIEVGTVNTRKVQGRYAPTGNIKGWDNVTTRVKFCNPVVVANIQTLNNLSSDANPPETPLIPWGTAVIDNITSNGFNLAIDMSETNKGVFSKDETIGYMVAEANITDNFTDSSGKLIKYETIKTPPYFVGWDDGCKSVYFKNNYTNTPLIAGWKDSRFGGDGGWFRRCNLTKTQVGFVVDEDKAHDTERHHIPEIGGIFAFSSNFVIRENKINHYEIWHYPSNLTCQPAPVEIKACANDNCSELYTDNVTLTLNYDGESEQITFSGGEDNTTITYTQPDNITLSTSNESPTPTSSTICHIFNSSSTSCVISFKDTGFVFKTPSNGDYIVNNGLSCGSYPVEIDAVEKNDVTNKCTKMSVFNGQVKVNLYGRYNTPTTNPAATQIVVDNSTAIQTVNKNATASGTPITLNFSSGTAYFNISYPDAGSIDIGAVYDNATTGLHVSGESNPFVIKPAKFIFDNLSNPADNSSCSTDECWSDIGVFKKAGEYFSFELKAVCDNGTVTPNYYPIDQNGDNSTVNLSALMIAPDNGTDASSFLKKTTILANEFSSGTSGVSEYFNNVGVISFKALQSNYLGAGSIEGNKKLGRFIPDHFKITSKDNGTLKESCTTFTYIGQQTTYDKSPAFVISAQNKDNQTTTFYKGYFFKLSSSEITITSPTTDDKQLGADGTNRVKLQIDRAAPTLKDNDNGTGTYTFGYDNVTYIRDNNSKIAPFSPKFTFVIDNITDSDGVEAVGLKDNVSVEGLSMKYGRLKIFDNYGPETEDLKMSVEAQFWDGNYWKINDDDSCTGLAKDDFILNNFSGNLSAGETYIIDGSVTGITSGKGSFILEAPGENNYGTVDVCLSSGSAFYDYMNDKYTCGRATFGIYRGRDRIIEWREVPAQ